MRGHRAVEPLAHARLGVARAGRAVQRELPVATGGDVPLPPPHEGVPGLELAHVRKRGGGGRDVAQLEIGVECFPVELARGQSGGVQRLEFRGERDPPGGGDDIQRLDPEAVSREQQRLRGRVPDGEGEHPAQG